MITVLNPFRKLSWFTRAVALMMLTWMVLFFAVVVPFHQRGAMLLPGFAQQEASATVGKVMCPLCLLGKKMPGEDDDEPAKSNGCVICHIKSALDTPGGLDLALPPMMLLAWADPPVAQLPCLCAAVELVRTRGPPVLA